MHWYLYELSPIDSFWENLKTVEQTAKELGAQSAAGEAAGFGDGSGAYVSISDFLSDWKDAKALVFTDQKELRNPPAVFWIPCEHRFAYGFVIKLETNGTTWVVSPVLLPHLGDPVT